LIVLAPIWLPLFGLGAAFYALARRVLK
jgi:hypothetical protein